MHQLQTVVQINRVALAKETESPLLIIHTKGIRPFSQILCWHA